MRVHAILIRDCLGDSERPSHFCVSDVIPGVIDALETTHRRGPRCSITRAAAFLRRALPPPSSCPPNHRSIPESGMHDPQSRGAPTAIISLSLLALFFPLFSLSLSLQFSFSVSRGSPHRSDSSALFLFSLPLSLAAPALNIDGAALLQNRERQKGQASVSLRNTEEGEYQLAALIPGYVTYARTRR